MRRSALLLLPLVLFAGPVYIDREKGLMWQDIPANKELLFTWEEAKEYCGYLRFYGHEDWWLPSEEQLVTLVNMKRKKGKRIHPAIREFRGAPYWTLTTYAFNAPHAWYVNFYDGVSISVEKKWRFHVRCVRRITEASK
jgi:hypothetical protein